MSTETEIKFTVPDGSVLDRLAALTGAAGFTVEDAGSVMIVDTCFDTSDLRLFHEKVVFRHRRKNDAMVLTFKAQGTSGASPEDGIHRRIEVEAPTTLTPNDLTTGHRIDHPACHALRERMGDVVITPSLIVRNRRRLCNLVRDGSVLFEMALDDVEFAGPKGKRPVRELEVEAKGGSDEDLAGIAAWFGERFDLEPAGPSKYILGMTMVGGAGQ